MCHSKERGETMIGENRNFFDAFSVMGQNLFGEFSKPVLVFISFTIIMFIFMLVSILMFELNYRKDNPDLAKIDMWTAILWGLTLVYWIGYLVFLFSLGGGANEW